MKKIYFITGLLLLSFAGKAQEETDLSEKKQQDIQALKVAFISKELDLSPDEAQKFWPVYNQYEKEMGAAIGENQENTIERDEKVLNVRKKYREQFTKVIGPQRMNRMFGAEGKFRQMLIRALQRQKMKRAMRNNNRPLLRNQ